MKARAASGSSTTNVRLKNTTPTSNDIISGASLDTTWRIYRGLIINPSALDEGASRIYLSLAGPSEMYIQYAKLRKINRETDIVEEEFTLKHRTDQATNNVDSGAVGDTFDVEETVATFQVTYNSISYTDTQQVTLLATPTTFSTDSGTGLLWNTKRKFTPGVPGWLFCILEFNDTDPVVALARVLKLGSTWYIKEEYKFELGAITGTSPFNINSSTGEITIEEAQGATVTVDCKFAFSIDRDKAERIFEYYN